MSKFFSPKFKIGLLIFLSLISVLAFSSVWAKTLVPPEGLTTFGQIINNIEKFLLWFAIPLVALAAIAGGVVFLTSFGLPERIALGKRIMIYAGIGLMVVIIGVGLGELFGEEETPTTPIEEETPTPTPSPTASPEPEESPGEEEPEFDAEVEALLLGSLIKQAICLERSAHDIIKGGNRDCYINTAGLGPLSEQCKCPNCSQCRNPAPGGCPEDRPGCCNTCLCTCKGGSPEQLCPCSYPNDKTEAYRAANRANKNADDLEKMLKEGEECVKNPEKDLVDYQSALQMKIIEEVFNPESEVTKFWCCH